MSDRDHLFAEPAKPLTAEQIDRMRALIKALCDETAAAELRDMLGLEAK
jgi:hypothetical protein